MDLMTILGFILAVGLMLFGITFNTDLGEILPGNIKASLTTAQQSPGGTFHL